MAKLTRAGEFKKYNPKVKAKRKRRLGDLTRFTGGKKGGKRGG